MAKDPLRNTTDMNDDNQTSEELGWITLACVTRNVMEFLKERSETAPLDAVSPSSDAGRWSASVGSELAVAVGREGATELTATLEPGEDSTGKTELAATADGGALNGSPAVALALSWLPSETETDFFMIGLARGPIRCRK